MIDPIDRDAESLASLSEHAEDRQTAATAIAPDRSFIQELLRRSLVLPPSLSTALLPDAAPLMASIGRLRLSCTYCGYRSQGYSTTLIGVDRIDSSQREYTLTNCVPCCSKCNFMKGNLEHHDFLAQVRAIAKWRTGIRF